MVHVNRCPQYLRDSVVSADSEPGRHHLRSVTILNCILVQMEPNLEREPFLFLGPLFEQFAFVRQIVADCSFKRNVKSHF